MRYTHVTFGCLPKHSYKKMRVCAGVGWTDPLPDCTRPFSYQEISMQLVQNSRLLNFGSLDDIV